VWRLEAAGQAKSASAMSYFCTYPAHIPAIFAQRTDKVKVRIGALLAHLVPCGESGATAAVVWECSTWLDECKDVLANIYLNAA